MIKNTRDYIDIMASALSEQTGVKIISGKRWRADVRHNTLEYDSEDLRALDFELSKGLLLHELGHIKFTKENSQIKTPLEQKYPRAGHELANAFEDIRITYKLNEEYGDFSRYPLQAIDEYFTRLNVKEHKDDYLKLPRLTQFLTLCLLYQDYLANYELHQVLGHYLEYILKTNNPVLSFDQSVIDRFNNNRYQIIEFLEAIKYKYTLDDLKQAINDKLFEMLRDFIEEFEKNPPAENGQGTAQSDLDKIKEAVLQTKRGNTSEKIGCDLKRSTLVDKARAEFEYGAVARTLGHRIVDILEERKATHYSGNKRSGKLLSKNIFKIPLNDKNIFSRKLNNLPDKYVFFLLIDNSQSMERGKRAYNATLAGYIFEIALQENGLPVNFIIYDVQAKKLNKMTSYETGGGTHDESALKLALDDFKLYPDFEKIVFIITDGDTYKSNERQGYIDKIKKDNGSIIAIGIGNGISKEILESNYPNSLLLENPSELPNAVVRLLSGIISR